MLLFVSRSAWCADFSLERFFSEPGFLFRDPCLPNSGLSREIQTLPISPGLPSFLTFSSVCSTSLHWPPRSMEGLGSLAVPDP